MSWYTEYVHMLKGSTSAVRNTRQRKGRGHPHRWHYTVGWLVQECEVTKKRNHKFVNYYRVRIVSLSRNQKHENPQNAIIMLVNKEICGK